MKLCVFTSDPAVDITQSWPSVYVPQFRFLFLALVLSMSAIGSEMVKMAFLIELISIKKLPDSKFWPIHSRLSVFRDRVFVTISLMPTTRSEAFGKHTCR